MDIRQVNLVLEKAIGVFQETEIDSLCEVGFTIPTPVQMHSKHGMSIPDEMKKPKFKVPSPKELYKKHGISMPPASIPSDSKGVTTPPPPLTGGWNGQDWYYKWEFDDGDIVYVRPFNWLKNGNLRVLEVRVDYGRRGARKAKLSSYHPMDFRRLIPVAKKDIKKVALNRFRDRL